MKKKLTAIFLCVALVAIAIVGASLAYFTDTDNATNTFTVGNVKIDLIEQQTGEDGLEVFDQNKPLVPGKANDGNAVSKIVTVKNTGANDAWVWVDLKIPAALVSRDFKADPHTDESKNALHWNISGYFVNGYYPNYKTLALNDGIIDENGNILITDMVDAENGLWNNYKYVGTETIDGVEYVVVRATMEKALPAGKISTPCLQQVYMDWRVTTGTDNEGKAI